jgi:hypothetical protein
VGLLFKREVALHYCEDHTKRRQRDNEDVLTHTARRGESILPLSSEYLPMSGQVRFEALLDNGSVCGRPENIAWVQVVRMPVCDKHKEKIVQAGTPKA